MPGYRSRKETLRYRRHLKESPPNEVCAFCALKKGDPQFVRQYEHFIVVRNTFPYTYWDGVNVTDHLMILPMQHTDTLADLPEAVAKEYLQILSDYEQGGYSSYARAPNSVIKSVAHHHTHLIKSGTKRGKFVVYVKSPYMRALV
jgi:diadenosine tetraphosphate (Ap4A) HIT family hydrolase